MARKTFSQVLGTGSAHPFTLRNSKGATETGYTDANPLSAVLWQGDALAAVATPLVEWNADLGGAPAGKARVAVTPADIAGLDPGLYHLQGFVGEADGTPTEIFHVFLRLTATAGTGVPAKVYGPADDLTDYYPAIDKLQSESDEAGFLEQRADARAWLEEELTDRWDGRKSDAGSIDPYRLGWSGLFDPYRDGWAGPEIVLGSYRPLRQPRDLAWLRAVLAADGLRVTRRVREIVAKKALSLILKPQLPDTATVQAGRKSSYQELAKDFAADAREGLGRLVAELDADADGTTDFTIDCRDRAMIR